MMEGEGGGWVEVDFAQGGGAEGEEDGGEEQEQIYDVNTHPRRGPIKQQPWAPSESWRDSIVRQIAERNEHQARPFVDVLQQHQVLLKRDEEMKKKMMQSQQEAQLLKVQLVEAKAIAEGESEGEGEKGNASNKALDEETKQDIRMYERNMAHLQMKHYEERENLMFQLTQKTQALEKLEAFVKELSALSYDNEQKLRARDEELAIVKQQLLTQPTTPISNGVAAAIAAATASPVRGTAPPQRRRSTTKLPIELVSLPTRLVHFARAHSSDIYGCAFTFDGRYLATAGTDGLIRLWSAETFKLACTLGENSKGHMITWLGFSQPSKLDAGLKGFLTATTSDGKAQLWSMAEVELSMRKQRRDSSNPVQPKHVLTGHSGPVNYAAVYTTSSSVTVATAGNDRYIKVWDMEKNYIRRSISVARSCTSLCFVEEEVICSAHSDGKLMFWDTRTASCNSEISVHSKRITSVVAVPPLLLKSELDETRKGEGDTTEKRRRTFRQRKLVLTCAQDNTLKVVDVEMYKVVAVYKAEDVERGRERDRDRDREKERENEQQHIYRCGGDRSKVCFSTDGAYIAAGGADGSVFIWSASQLLSASELLATQHSPHDNEPIPLAIPLAQVIPRSRNDLLAGALQEVVTNGIGVCTWAGNKLVTGSATGEFSVFMP